MTQILEFCNKELRNYFKESIEKDYYIDEEMRGFQETFVTTTK